MSMAIKPTNCKRCGKPLSMFEGRYCLECQKEIDKETEIYEGNTGVFDEPYPWRPNDIIGILKHIIEVADTNSCGVKEIDGIDEEAINNAITIIGSFEQIKWERDTAIAQLKELGYEFGEKIETIDDKPVTGIRKYRKEARRWKRKYIRANNQLSKCKKLLENDDIQSHTDEMWEKAKESEVNNGQETD